MVLVNKQQSELPDFYMTFFTAGILAGHSREAQLITLNMAAVYLCEPVQIKVSAVKKKSICLSVPVPQQYYFRFHI